MGRVISKIKGVEIINSFFNRAQELAEEFVNEMHVLQSEDESYRDFDFDNLTYKKRIVVQEKNIVDRLDGGFEEQSQHIDSHQQVSFKMILNSEIDGIKAQIGNYLDASESVGNRIARANSVLHRLQSLTESTEVCKPVIQAIEEMATWVSQDSGASTDTIQKQIRQLPSKIKKVLESLADLSYQKDGSEVMFINDNPIERANFITTFRSLIREGANAEIETGKIPETKWGKEPASYLINRLSHYYPRFQQKLVFEKKALKFYDTNGDDNCYFKSAGAIRKAADKYKSSENEDLMQQIIGILS